MAAEDWLTLERPKNQPGSCMVVLEAAERRLLGSLKRNESRAKLVANAERVRRAQLGVVKAQARVATLPTDVEDAELSHRRANLEHARDRWATATVDAILDYYALPAPRRPKTP